MSGFFMPINQQHQVFEPSFDRKECHSIRFMQQKSDYIHLNSCKDFKDNGIKSRPEGVTQDQYRYRGMSVEGVGGLGSQDGTVTTFASARDIGNVGAGYVAGSNGESWGMSRLALDGYQIGSGMLRGNFSFKTEGRPTQMAERVGFNLGQKAYEKANPLKALLHPQKPFPPH
ncbi:MAG TPA: hypothetical protein VJ552_02320 [Sediminibacterium sp.]|nr:hypothetical protein [Sediminibacterium sp.]